MNFKIFEQKTLHNIPSASGLAKHKESYYVLGDDSPFLFKLNSQFKIEEKIPLIANEHREKIPKPDKADFEALEVISKDEILGFGSGSLSPQRDSMIRIRIGIDAKVQIFSLTAFYSLLKDLEIMKGSELNIEALAFHEDVLYLFNRRKNVVFSFSYSEFISALETNTPFPAIQASGYRLPEINGIEAGFSGATVTATGKLVATCSVENTGNAYDDGEIFGSFVGFSSGVERGIFKSILWTPINSEAALKVESVSVEQEILETEMDLVLVTDSDGGDSLIILGKLKV